MLERAGTYCLNSQKKQHVIEFYGTCWNYLWKTPLPPSDARVDALSGLMNPIAVRPLRTHAISGNWLSAIACDIAGRMIAWRR
jgi:hypothetical protein